MPIRPDTTRSRRRWIAALAGLALAAAVPVRAEVHGGNPYYAGPKSDHFDGRRFFNPDGEQGTGGQQKQSRLGLIEQGLGKGGYHSWPRSVPIQRSVPPARVAGARMLVTWIGHSTVLIQTEGLNILLDPVWSERDSPLPFTGPRRVRQPGVRLADLPRIDLVLISHDHYDHLDLGALKRIWKRDRPLIVTGLGNDRLIAKAGLEATARDWGQAVEVRPDVRVRLQRAHHWSAHGLHDHDMTLWTGFTIALPHGDIYYAGDTGAGDMRWAEQAMTERPVRLAILPIGAIKIGEPPSGNHIGPPEAVTAFQQLRAAYALGVHWGTFELTSEPIDGPPRLLAQTLAERRLPPDRFRVLEAGQAWDIPTLP